jgi:hypothetical protein
VEPLSGSEQALWNRESYNGSAQKPSDHAFRLAAGAELDRRLDQSPEAGRKDLYDLQTFPTKYVLMINLYNLTITPTGGCMPLLGAA